MIEDTILFKVTFIVSGGNKGSVTDSQCCQGSAGLSKGLLHTDMIIGSIRFRADRKHISAKVDDTVFYAVFCQKFLQLVGNITFGNETKIQSGFWIKKSNGIAGELYLCIINVGECFFYIFSGRDNSLIGISKAPEIREGTNGRIHKTA